MLRTGVPLVMPSISRARAQSERLFKQALEIDPELSEARLRLAHSLGDRGTHRQALVEIDESLTKSLPRLLTYYALILKGREERSVGQTEHAREAFERALEVLPSSTVARWGLSEIAMASGDRGEAMRHLVAAPDGPDADQDPWFRIGLWHEPGAQQLLDEMREAFR